MSIKHCGISIISVYQTLWYLNHQCLSNTVVSQSPVSIKHCGISIISVYQTLWYLNHQCLSNTVVSQSPVSIKHCGISIISVYQTLWYLNHQCLSNTVVSQSPMSIKQCGISMFIRFLLFIILVRLYVEYIIDIAKRWLDMYMVFLYWIFIYTSADPRG